MRPRVRDDQWRLRSACAPLVTMLQRDPDGSIYDIWYPEGDDAPQQRDIARRICQQCPVTRDCLADAMREEWGVTSGAYRQGIRGGMFGSQRARLEQHLRGKDVEIGKDEEGESCEIAS